MNENRTIKRRKLNKANIQKIKEDLENKKLGVTSDTVDNEFLKIHREIMKSLDRFAPEQEIVIRCNKTKAPQITRGLERSMQKCNKKYCIHLKDRTNETKYHNYKIYRQTLNRIKKKARRDYYSKLCSDLRRDSKKLWRIKITDKTLLIEEIRSDRFLITDGKQISNCFAKYFSEVGRTCYSKIAKPKRSTDWYLQQIPRSEKTLFMMPITSTEIGKLIGVLPNKSSSGYDDISNILLKELHHLIKQPLADLFNRSMQEGVFLDAMKLADTVPLFKSKEHTLTTN